MTLENQIRDWFHKRSGGGLVLPDGWFGRPYDNVHHLSQITFSADRLSLSLDDGQLLLVFEGLPEIEASHDELVFSAFKSLRFDWREYGSNTPHSDRFESGLVKVVATPGT